MSVEFLTPEDVPNPSFLKGVTQKAYSQIVTVRPPKTIVFFAGVTSTNEKGEIVCRGDLEGQIRQVFDNLDRCLKAVGASWKDVVNLRYYMTDIRRNDVFRKIRREFLDAEKPPSMTAIGVAGLASPDYLVEVEMIAAVD